MLAYADCSLHSESPPDLGLQCMNDQFLMDTFFSFGQFSNSNLSSINHCHIAKCAPTIADICSGNGTCIWCDISLPHVSPSPSKWIWQCEQPSATDWGIWSQALQWAFGPQLIIAIPLGDGSDLHINHLSTFLMTLPPTYFTNWVITQFGEFLPNSLICWLPIALPATTTPV